MSEGKKPLSALIVDSGDRPIASRRPKPKKRAPGRNPLASPRKKQPRQPGVESLMGSGESQPASQPNSQHGLPFENQSGGDSSGGENAEVRERLNSIPDIIGPGEEPGEPGEPEITSEEVREILIVVQFSEQDVKDLLSELFDWLSELMGSDHWKLTERQARILTGPTHRMLASIWAKLLQRLPDAVVKWCEETPGAAAFLVALGIVATPKALQQRRVWKGKKERRTVEGEKPEPAPADVRTGDGPIPTATGIIGGMD